MMERPPRGYSFVDCKEPNLLRPSDRTTQIRGDLALMAEANTELQGLLPQSSNRPLHLLGDFDNRRLSFRVLAQFNVHCFRPRNALGRLCFLCN